MNDWRDIATAPRDGRRIMLGWLANGELEWQAVSWWDADHWRDHYEPTHWKPLSRLPLDRLQDLPRW